MAVKEEKSIFELELHEQFYYSKINFKVTRVPGGWIYSKGNSDKALTSVFIPITNEGQPSKYNNPNEESFI